MEYNPLETNTPMQEPEQEGGKRAAASEGDAQWKGRVLEGGVLPEEPEM